MATILSYTLISPQLNSKNRAGLILRPNQLPRIYKLRCTGQNSRGANSSTNKESNESENVLLKVAWYSSELLGIAASVFRSPAAVETPTTSRELAGDGSGAVDRAMVVETIKDDFQRSYFVTGWFNTNKLARVPTSLVVAAKILNFLGVSLEIEKLERKEKKEMKFKNLLEHY